MHSKSSIIIGCMSWGAWGKQLSTSDQSALIEFCLEQGNTIFDHADIYGDYTTEAGFGKALKASGVDRQSIQLISKCGIQYVGKTRNNRVKHYNYTKEYIIWSAEESLKNLQSEYLDTFLLHRPSPLMHPDEIAEAVRTLKESGKIKRFGVSNFAPSHMALLSRAIDVEVNQIEFSLTQHQAMHDGTLDHMLSNNVEAMFWSPLGSYFKDTNPQTERIREILNGLCEKYNADASTLLLAWSLKHPVKGSPVIGTTNKERIVASNKALTLQLELEDWFALLVASQGHKVP